MKHTLHLIISAALLSFSMAAQAAVSIAIKEVGADIIVSGSGSINNLGTLTLREEAVPEEYDTLLPFKAAVGTGGNRLVDIYTGLTGPKTIGEGIGHSKYGATASQPFLIVGSAYQEGVGAIYLPADYVEGAPLFFKFIIPNETINSLEIDVGTYEWTWGTPEDGDSVTLCVGDSPSCVLPDPPPPPAPTSVPTLGAFGLMGLAGVVGAAGAAMARRRKSH